ncbi:HET-domain-containing protein [Lentinus tigrinus ALCF2SS1-6]|uniref:HET-domain-containing protein n=1 Tax=Lentinus tigrinus ALCF2SS1-6 TaxID=1328759 RepID=A0A5C2RUH6_9APHY|nr:HET-domain-containing protein [Lentinus tigrinus ALCF2SS1-6]
MHSPLSPMPVIPWTSSNPRTRPTSAIGLTIAVPRRSCVAPYPRHSPHLHSLLHSPPLSLHLPSSFLLARPIRYPSTPTPSWSVFFPVLIVAHLRPSRSTPVIVLLFDLIQELSMWVLSTARAELHSFRTPEEVPGGFAALSHTWNNEPEDGPPEQSFQDVRKIQKRCARKGTNPRDFVGEKIRRCCELAESHGYKWVWIDTCCIDKTSSAELSEAINSMFRYYALARICYGYLRDVPGLDDICHSRSQTEEFLVRSIWLKRGWTLQELIAPRFFLFLSKSWDILGSKADLAEVLEREHDIPATVLRLEVSHTEFSIAQRMSWFGYRQTTRVEDEAYCLLGLFDIHMPPLYGEGRNAFRRLQEEIMRQSADTTLFAWGGHHSDKDLRSCLLAPSPSAFYLSSAAYTPPQHNEEQAHLIQNDAALEYQDELQDEMTFSITPDGILAHIPLIVCGGQTFADLSWTDCWYKSRVLLALQADSSQRRRASRRPLYIVSVRETLRMTYTDPPSKSGIYTIRGRSASASWRTILIKHRPSPHRLPGQLSDPRTPSFIPAAPTQLALDTPFRFDEACIQRFMCQSRMGKVEVRNGQFCESRVVNLGNKPPPTAYIFTGGSVLFPHIIIKIGQCGQEGFPTGDQPWLPRRAPVWAKVHFVWVGRNDGPDITTKLSDDAEHDCWGDHIMKWSRLQKSFHVDRDLFDTVVEDKITLSFKRCPINPGGTLVLDASYTR